MVAGPGFHSPAAVVARGDNTTLSHEAHGGWRQLGAEDVPVDLERVSWAGTTRAAGSRPARPTFPAI